ncbi:MAG: serine hydrolase [Balneolales bacterium]
MRLLKFLGVFLTVATLLIGSIFYLNRDAFVSVFENRSALAEGSEWVEKTYSLSGLVEYMGQHPQYVSVVSYDINDPEKGIYYQAHKERVMGSSVNIFILIEYARQVSEGTLNPDQLVSLDDLNQYHLPDIDDNRHREAIRSLKDNNLVTADEQIKISDVVSTMVQKNDLASADFLYYFLGPDKINNTTADIGDNRIEAPLPYSGLHISFNPPFNNQTPNERHDELLTLSKDDLLEEVSSSALAYQNDEAFRSQVIEHFENDGLGLSFMDERLMYDIFPKGEPEALTAILEKIVRGDLFSEEASSIIRDHLSWPMSASTVTRDFDFYGALYDNRISLLNGLDMGTSTYTKNQHVQAVFFEKLPIGFWMHMSSNFMSQDYQKRLIYDPALYEVSKATLTP